MMALEPITRQEQIIAGKDLQPITRMEKFLKEYGGFGGNVDQPVVIHVNGEIGDYVETDDFSGILYDQQAIKSAASAVMNNEIVSVIVTNRAEYGDIVDVHQFIACQLYYCSEDNSLTVWIQSSNNTGYSFLFFDGVIFSVTSHYQTL